MCASSRGQRSEALRGDASTCLGLRERHDVETKLVSAARVVALVGLQHSSIRPWERGRRPAKRRTTKSYKKIMFTRNIIHFILRILRAEILLNSQPISFFGEELKVQVQCLEMSL